MHNPLIEYQLCRSPTKSAVLFYGNYFFTAVFAAESTVKLFAMGPRYFFAVNIVIRPDFKGQTFPDDNSSFSGRME